MVMRHESYAIQLKAEIHAEWERHKEGYCAFNIERWTGKLYTDVLEFCEDWMVNVIEPKRKPGTVCEAIQYWIKQGICMNDTDEGGEMTNLKSYNIPREQT